jgi:hypothetical protein
MAIPESCGHLVDLVRDRGRKQLRYQGVILTWTLRKKIPWKPDYHPVQQDLQLNQNHQRKSNRRDEHNQTSLHMRTEISEASYFVQYNIC